MENSRYFGVEEKKKKSFFHVASFGTGNNTSLGKTIEEEDDSMGKSINNFTKKYYRFLAVNGDASELHNQVDGGGRGIKYAKTAVRSPRNNQSLMVPPFVFNWQQGHPFPFLLVAVATTDGHRGRDKTGTRIKTQQEV